MRKIMFLSAMVALVMFTGCSKPWSLTSPNGRIAVDVRQDVKGLLTYTCLLYTSRCV